MSGGVGAVLAAMVPLLVVGCATDRSGNEDGRAAARASASGIDEASLAALAARERKSPRRADPGFSPRWAGFSIDAPLKADELVTGSPAVESLGAWLAALPERRIAEAVEITDGASLRLYASGRLRIADGKFADAVRDLEEAARLNPSAAAPLRELALAQAAQGQRASSMSTLRRAIELGLNDPQSYWLLGRDEIRQRRHEAAAELLGWAYLETAARPGSELHRLVAADLAESLRHLGRYAASRELLLVAASPGSPTASNSIYRAEAMELNRRAGDVWAQRGELALGLGLPEEALTDFARALEEATTDRVGVVLRMVVAEVRLGRRASAAQRLVDAIGRSGGAAEDREIRAIADLAGSPGIADALVHDVSSLTRTTGIGPRAGGRLVRAIASGLPRERAAELLRERLGRTFDDSASLAALLESRAADDAAGRADELRWYVSRAPMMASEAATVAVGIGRDLAGLAAAVERGTSPTDVLLRWALAAQMGREREAVAALEAAAVPDSMRDARDLLVVRIASAMGDWDRVSTSLQRLTTRDGNDSARMLALASAQRFQASAGVADGWLSAKGEGATASDCLVAAALMADAGRFGDAVRLNERAMAIDPTDERAHTALSAITGPDGPAPDATMFVATGRAARMNVPGSGVIRYYQFRDLMSRRQIGPAEAALRSTIEPFNESAALLDTLADVWRLAGDPSSKTDPKVLDEAKAWMEALRSGREDSPDLTLCYARLLLARNAPEDAERVLREAAARLPIARLKTAQADVLIGPLRRPAVGRAILEPILSQRPRSIGHALLWASVAASNGRWSEAAETVDELPREMELTPPQMTDLLAVIARRVANPQETISSADHAGVALIMDRARAFGVSFDLPLHAVRLGALCGMEPADTERIARAIEDAAGTGETFRAAVGEVLNLLGKRGDTPTAIAVTARVAPAMPVPDPALVAVWLQLVVQSGTVADAETLVRGFKDASPLRDLLNQFGNRLNPIPVTDEGVRAEIAFAIANDWSALGRERDGFEMFRLALRLDPDHGWAANNLGYGLLEADGPTEEAARWIEHAAALLPDESSVVDSLAWLRFKQGVLEDAAGDGGTRTAGAISLLQRAIGLPGGEENADVFDHLGDALDRAGRRAEALEAWRRAAALLTVDMGRARAMNADPRIVARLLETSRNVRKKIDGANGGPRDAGDNGKAPAEPAEPN